NRLYFAGAGGTVYYIDNPDTAGATTTRQVVFYGKGNYTHALDDGSVFINTPITSDSSGDIFFGFEVTGSTPITLQNGQVLKSGIARLDPNGNGTWTSAAAAANDPRIDKVVLNNSPALSNDQKTLY